MHDTLRPATREEYEQRIIRVQLHIHQHLDEPLPLSELAAVACFSPFHFHRIFAAMVGETPGEFIRRLRLERAAQLLTGGAAEVGEVALAAGYDAPEAFSRAFRERYGMPPAEYRRHHGTAVGTEPPEFSAKLIRSEGVTMQVKVEKLGPWTVAALRHVGPYEECGQAWGQLMASPHVRRQLRWGTLMFGMFYDDPQSTAPENLRMDACVTVAKGFKATDGLERLEIPKGDYAVLRHVGPYSGLGDSYKYLYGEWLPQSGREPADRPCLEIYRNNPQKVPEHKLITDICVPLQ